MGIDHYRLGFLIHKANKNYEEAVWFLEIYKSKYDSLVKRRHNNRLSTLQARLETNQKESEVESLSQNGQFCKPRD